MRAAELVETVMARGACGRPNDAPLPDEWFRDDESDAEWADHAERLKAFCREVCPVMAECRELALRQGEGRSREDDVVRGGLSGFELLDLRVQDATRLRAEAAKDRSQLVEWRRYMAAAAAVHAAGAVITRPSAERSARARRQREAAVRRLQEVRQERRARARWTVAQQDDHGQADEALRRAREADRRETAGAGGGR
ncbi:WhiB family transcriptional regulator [Streptomyces luteireticuli]|uniref:WhiB family transcriptional regulator n=1 Tax=Streptomyces luteireticuli TaxID=173858 RepID=UPI0035577D8D